MSDKEKSAGCPKCLDKFSRLFALFEKSINLLGKLQPLSLVALRLAIGMVFFKSALTKIPSDVIWFSKGNWDTTLVLFEYDHPVPFLSPEIAAFTASSFEFICPILLAIGLATRPAAFILLCMTAVIEFTYQHVDDHYLWAAMLLTLITNGGGKLSLDYIIRRKAKECPNYSKIIEENS